MHLLALANAVPSASFTQEQCWEIFQHSKIRRSLKERTAKIVRKILLGSSGITKRHFALDDVDRIFDLDAEELNRAFEKEAPGLAETAARRALEAAALGPSDLDALFICTCTGYICPGISSHVSERLGLRRDAYLQDIVGLGCGAAIPTLRSAHHMLGAQRDGAPGRVAVIAVEVCSAAFFLNDEPGVIISACIFGDGASASIWSNHPGESRLAVDDFDTVHLPENRELLRFVNRAGKLKNHLHRSVPVRAREAVQILWERRPAASDSDRVVSHGGGKDVIQELEEYFPGQDFSPTANVLRQYGNMSSPSVLFALEEVLNRSADDPPPPLWLVSFGAGFSAHSCRIRRHDP